MRVAMITNYPVDPKILPGGIAAAAHYLVKGLARIPALELHVVCCQSDVDYAREESRDGVRVHFLPDPDRFSLLTNQRFPRQKIREALRRIAPDLVHAQGLGLSTQAALDSGLPFAVTLHGIIWRESRVPLPSLVKRLRGRIRARRARAQILKTDNVFVISEYAARALPPAKSFRKFVVNNPVGEEIFAIRNRPGHPHVLVVGGLRERKDPMTALRVMERVLRDVPHATMDLLGPPSNTSLDNEVARSIEERALSKSIRVLGLVPEATLWDEYRKASVLLMTSLEETAPMAIGEAYAAGIPVVGTDAGGIPFIVREGETGFVRPVKDVEALAQAVIHLLEKPELRARLAENAKRVGRAEFSLESISRRTFAAYGEILST